MIYRWFSLVAQKVSKIEFLKIQKRKKSDKKWTF